MKEDIWIGKLAGKGFRVFWDGSGIARRLLVSNGRWLVGRPLPDDNRRTSDDIFWTIDRLVKHLTALDWPQAE